ncbi:phage protease [Methylogaea oryzae]|uniref:phage protease n=1 Tax=Methylogaea oryzae TaxID=1295382 RepID=UPI0006D1703A|nr:phage protease [Methylogaea oryzae]
MFNAQSAEIAALKSASPDPAKYVPMEQHAQVQNELAALTAKVEGGERDRLMTAALSDGRILAAQEAYWRAQPLAALTAYLDVAQPIAALTGTQTGGKPPEGKADALSADQLAICSQLGISAEDYQATLAAQA